MGTVRLRYPTVSRRVNDPATSHSYEPRPSTPHTSISLVGDSFVGIQAVSTSSITSSQRQIPVESSVWKMSFVSEATLALTVLNLLITQSACRHHTRHS